MPVESSTFKNKPVPMAKRVLRGLYALVESAQGYFGLQDSCSFEICTGSTALADIPFTAGTTTLLADSEVPTGLKMYITSIQVVALTGFTGGTAGTVSATIQDSAAVAIATYTQTALTTTGNFAGLPTASLPTGVVDSKVSLMAGMTVNKGLQILMANSTAGSLRVRVSGYFAA